MVFVRNGKRLVLNMDSTRYICEMVQDYVKLASFPWQYAIPLRHELISQGWRCIS